MTQTIAASATTGTTTTSHNLTPEQIEELGRELDEIRDDIMSTLGARDAAYIRTVITVQRAIELSSRAVLLFSRVPAAWVLGTAGLAVAKTLENMEIGHNILHGQWDWMRDPKIHSSTWEWDAISPAKQWQYTHNELHHTYTNVIGRDNDLGYGIMRVSEDQPWTLYSLIQAPVNLLNAAFFEYGIALYDMEALEYVEGRVEKDVFVGKAKEAARKLGRQVAKDYIIHPLVSGPNALSTLTATFTANMLRNLWTHSVIICGHFPEGVETFETDSIEGETRGGWYLRQMLGSANISGPYLMHVMTGNLSFQIEHHLFPDMPSNRYAEAAPRVREVFDRYGLRYVSGPLHKQLGSAWWKIIRLSVPNHDPDQTRLETITNAVRESVRGLGGRLQSMLGRGR